ncbi:heterokaryon incompatibility protein-domain-containing protein [Hypoxylon sp. FL1284]|nr:heterokaryon incompatibility protein-domain-containing protein [Hypoxylon sp. FL1284]
MPAHLLNLEGDIPKLVSRPSEDIFAILSHRWIKGDDEEFYDIVYEDIVEGLIENPGPKQAGYDKLIGACRQAKLDGHKHIWIDSCCFDKRNTAEQSEAINSMFSYYQIATMCYAYLTDLPNNPFDAHFGPSFANHEWFERGWTLQELIAPKEVKFFTDMVVDGKRDSQRWYYLGRKTEMCNILSRATGIDASILSHERQVSVAKRMSWAAKRTTFKVEDRAYCMMGLFDVSMPMLYGEGEKAFIWLQEEIMKDSSDESLFAWRNGDAHADDQAGLLATSPDMFADSGHIVDYYDWEPRVPYYKTNRGLQITLYLRYVEKSLYLATLNCTRPQGSGGFSALYLRRLDELSDTGNNQYARVQTGKIIGLDDVNERGNTTIIYVRQTTSRHDGDRFKEPACSQALEMDPAGLDTAFRVILEKNKLSAVVVFARPDGSKITILLGSSSDIGEVAAEVVNGCEESRKFGDWAQAFQPQPLGSLVDLGDDLVRVDINLRIVHGYKYYLVNVHVEEAPTIIDDLVDMFNDPPLRGTLDTIPNIAGIVPDNRASAAAPGREDRFAGFKKAFKH